MKKKVVKGSKRTKPRKQIQPKGKPRKQKVEKVKRTRKGKSLSFTIPNDFYVTRVTVVHKLKEAKKEVTVKNKKLNGGIYKREVIRGKNRITVYRKYVKDRKQARKFLEKKHRDFMKGESSDTTISGMVQHVAGKVINRFKGTLGKGSQAKKGSYLKSAALGKLKELKKSALDVRIHNRIEEVDRELEAIEQEYAIRYYL